MKKRAKKGATAKVKIKLKKEIKKIPKIIKKSDDIRVSSGISGFDKLVENGFIKDSSNLVMGPSGSGKTIFAMHFLMNGIKNNENVLYVTFTEKKEAFFKYMLDFNWDLQKAEKAGKFVFLEYNPEQLRIMIQEGGGAMESIVLKHNIKRIVIDSISDFLSLFSTESEKKSAILSLFEIMKRWNTTDLFTFQKTAEKKSRPNLLEYEADSVIEMYFVRRKTKRERFLEIIKMKGTKHSTKIYPFEIGKSGIDVGSKSTKNHFF